MVGMFHRYLSEAKPAREKASRGPLEEVIALELFLLWKGDVA